MKKIILFAFISLVVFSTKIYAAPGDTTWVQANITNLDNYGNFDDTVGFPGGSITYRKILMIFTMGEHSCPTGTQYCHQWDYTINNYLITSTDTVELSRFISPYATAGTPRFPTTWKKDYIFDVTDFYPLLKDTATVRIHYSGYSGGFTANVKFAFIEGVPPRNVIGMEPVWSGYFYYGNTADPISNHLPAYTLTVPANTQSSELRYIVTGHGADNTSQCCEFSTSNTGHNYSILVNNNTIDTKNIWRDDCGFNELYAQGGTWIYNRANWCPGNIVDPFIHQLGVTSGSYTLGNTYDNYTGSGSYGGYDINGEVIYYGAFNHALDASIEDIVAPTNADDYFRENPCGSNPIIRVRNTGSTAITSIKFQYNIKDSAVTEFTWTGNLLPLEKTDIKLAALNTLTDMSLNSISGLFKFEVKILTVNGITDEDATNDKDISTFIAAPTWPQKILVTLKTNTDGENGIGSNPSETSWQITDMNNNVVASRTNAYISTTYIDTVSFANPGFYKLTITDLGCNGLHWWVWDSPNPSYGHTAGSFSVKKVSPATNLAMHGYVYSGGYRDDFGCGFTQYFTTDAVNTTDLNDQEQTSTSFDLYPNPSTGYFTISSGKKNTGLVDVKIFNVTGEQVKQFTWNGESQPVNLSEQPKGVYLVKFLSKNSFEYKKIVIR